jgi:hypothetical protein
MRSCGRSPTCWSSRYPTKGATSGRGQKRVASALSRTLRAIGPTCQMRRGTRGQIPVIGTRPRNYPGGPLPPRLARGTESLQTRRWSKGDSNSPSHPERERSEERHMGPRTQSIGIPISRRDPQPPHGLIRPHHISSEPRHFCRFIGVRHIAIPAFRSPKLSGGSRRILAP